MALTPAQKRDMDLFLDKGKGNMKLRSSKDIVPQRGFLFGNRNITEDDLDNALRELENLDE